MKVTLGQLEDADSTLDVTKLLIAHALRTGAVEQTSWATLIDAVLRRPSRKFIWTKPTAPVFWRYRKGGRAIDFSGPAPVRQQYQIVRLAAELTGMLEVPTTHDVRRGAASDTAGLTLKPSTTDAVRQSLGHSMSVMNRGLTEAYIGRQKTDMWASRVKNAPTVESPGLAVPDPFGVTIATQPFKKRRVVVEDVDRYCDDHKLDKTKKTARMAASRELGKMQREVWVSQQRAVLDGDGSAESDRPPLKDVTNIAVGTSTSDNGRRPSKASPDDSTEAIDPRLRVFSQALGMEDADGRNDESMNEALAETFEVLQELEEANGGTMPTVLTADIDTYIGYLSTVNLVATSSELGNLTDSGNSRDPPSLFVYSCDGCGRTFDTPNRLAKHQANCAGATFHTTDATTALDDVQTDDVDGVATATDDAAVQPTAASKKRKRKSMKGVVDEGFPKQCPDMAECGETKMFTNKKNLSNHRLAHHDKNWPTVPCNVPFCLLPPTHLFKSRKTFRTHLRSTHHLNEQQGLEYIGKIVELKGKVPKSLRESFVPTKCLFPGCTSTTVYQDYENYAWHHLHDVHHLTSNDYPAYLPGSRTTTSTD